MKKIIQILFASFLILILAEIGAWFYLSKSQDQRQLFYASTADPSPLLQKLPQYNKHDIHLGWTFEAEKDGFVISKSHPDQMKGRISIAILGGSTSDQSFDPMNWPHWLQKSLTEKGYAVKIFNGAVAGYNSSKEVLKFIRDVMTIQPDIVISLSGINEKYQRVPGHPFSSRFDKKRLTDRPSRFLPNTTHLVRGLLNYSEGSMSLGLVDPSSVADVWLRNMRTIHSVAQVNGIGFLPVLQGALGTANRELDEHEHELMKTHLDAKHYRKRISHYPEIRKSLVGHPYIVDLSQFFFEDSTPLLDLCHMNEAGNRKLGEKIADLILQMPQVKPL